MNEFEKNGFATFIDNGDGWVRIPNAKFMMRDENGTEIEMTPNEVIKQLIQDNKSLEHYIYNLQSKIDKTIKILKYDGIVEDIFYALGMLFEISDYFDDETMIPKELRDILKENK